MLRRLKQPAKPSAEEQKADEEERQRNNIPQREWGVAYAWAVDGYEEVQPPPEPTATPRPGLQPFQVLPGNWATVMLFMACDTRWRLTERGAFELDYAGVDIVLKRSKLADPDRTFAELQAMEMAALEVLHGHG